MGFEVKFVPSGGASDYFLLDVAMDASNYFVDKKFKADLSVVTVVPAYNLVQITESKKVVTASIPPVPVVTSNPTPETSLVYYTITNSLVTV